MSNFPGLMIAVSFLELYSGQTIYGATKFIHGISIASMVGFGLALGYLVCAKQSSTPISFANGCTSPVSPAWYLLIFPIYMLVISIRCNSTWNQVPGQLFVMALGFMTTNYLNGMSVPFEITPFVGAIVITSAGRLFAWMNKNERPIVYIMAGLMILTPGIHLIP